MKKLSLGMVMAPSFHPFSPYTSGTYMVSTDVSVTKGLSNMLNMTIPNEFSGFFIHRSHKYHSDLQIIYVL